MILAKPKSDAITTTHIWLIRHRKRHILWQQLTAILNVSVEPKLVLRKLEANKCISTEHVEQNTWVTSFLNYTIRNWVVFVLTSIYFEMELEKISRSQKGHMRSDQGQRKKQLKLIQILLRLANVHNLGYKNIQKVATVKQRRLVSGYVENREQ